MAFGDRWRKLFDPGTKEGPRFKTGPLLLILLVVGVALLLFNSFFNFGGKKTGEPLPEESTAATGDPEERLSRNLAAILSRVRGVGRVEVFLTPGTSGKLEPVADREQSRRRTSEGDGEGGNREIVEETERETHVVLRDPQGNERPLVAEENAPRYRGVLVVAAGVEDEAVKEAIVEALQALLGLPAHRITVLPRQ